jgi:hypothetical protein
MSHRGSKSGLTCTKTVDAVGCLAPGSACRAETGARALYDAIRPELGTRFLLAIDETVDLGSHPCIGPILRPGLASIKRSGLPHENMFAETGSVAV